MHDERKVGVAHNPTGNCIDDVLCSRAMEEEGERTLRGCGEIIEIVAKKGHRIRIIVIIPRTQVALLFTRLYQILKRVLNDARQAAVETANAAAEHVTAACSLNDYTTESIDQFGVIRISL